LHLAYQQYTVEQRLMDYDDLLRNWWKLLLEWPEVCKLLAETYQYIMVDEYQDTNKLQAEIVRLLASQRPNVMVVGDDSQSIYSFRGADFKNIMEFPKLFPGARLIKLEQNYRSTQPILNFTNELIAQAHEHYTKCLFSERESANLPSVVSASKDKDQSLFVVQTIRQFQARGLDLSEMAVLFRASFHSYDLEVELARAGIAFVKYGGLRFAETAHLKDVVAHLRVVHNPLDAVSWHRLLLLIDGIGAKTAERLIHWLMENGPSAAGIRSFIAQQKKTAWVGNLGPLAALMEELSHPERTVLEMVQTVCRYYEPLAVRHYDDYPKRLKDLTFLEGWAEQYPSLAAMLTDLALEPPDFYGQRKGQREEGTLTLSTIHSAKGLEWRVVFIISVAEGRFPSPYAAYRDNDLEEERRLLYVAATRARDFLVITHANMYGGAGNEGYGVYAGGPSPFLLNISAHHLKRLNAATFSLERLEQGAQASHGPTHAEKSAEVAGFAPGRRVDHPTFGRGVILRISDNRITVAFENHGSKILDGRHAPLKLPDHYS
jgi:DNA helicase-2/ATP-dependent DNA helicase PcrA